MHTEAVQCNQRENLFVPANKAKADFKHIYNLPDPRRYFSVLGGLGYVIPGEARPIFAAVIAALRRSRGLDRVNVLDFGCSYGTNAALLKFGLTLGRIYHHYGCPELRGLSHDEVLRKDRAFFRGCAPRRHIRVVGADVAERAVAYGRAAGLLDTAITENLEETEPSEKTAAELRAIDVMISTGCVGYVTERSFARTLSCMRSAAVPWVASFVLRMFPYDRITRTLSAFGLATEKLNGRTFVQRRFADADEQRVALRAIEDLGIDPTGKEADGNYHAEFFLSRPSAEVRALPLEAVLSPAT